MLVELAVQRSTHSGRVLSPVHWQIVSALKKQTIVGGKKNNPLYVKYDAADFFGSSLVFAGTLPPQSGVLKRMNFASAKLDVSSLPGTVERLLSSGKEGSQ